MWGFTTLSINLNHGQDFLSLFARSILFKAEPPEKREIGGEIQVPFVVSSTPLLHVTLRVELLNTTRARISDPVQMSSKSCAPWGFAVASPGFTTYSLSFSTFLRDRNKPGNKAEPQSKTTFKICCVLVDVRPQRVFFRENAVVGGVLRRVIPPPGWAT